MTTTFGKSSTNIPNTLTQEYSSLEHSQPDSQPSDRLNKRARNNTIVESSANNDNSEEYGEYIQGSIVRVKLKNFVTYDSVDFRPGPNMNMIIGPNGCGKSTIVCAICIGLGWGPQILGRAKKLSEFVKHGAEEASITIELKDFPENLIITRNISRLQEGSSWMIRGKTYLLIETNLTCVDKSAPKKIIDAHMKRLNVQVDNLCQFLPQDRVCEFAQLTPEKLLQETERAAGDSRMLTQHNNLIKLQTELSEISTEVGNSTQRLATLNDRQTELEVEVEKLRERKRLHAIIEELQLQIPLILYNKARSEHQHIKTAYEQSKKELKIAEKKHDPLIKHAKAAKSRKDELQESKAKAAARYNRCKQNLVTALNELKQIKPKYDSLRADIKNEKIQKVRRGENIKRMRNEISNLQRDTAEEPRFDDDQELRSELDRLESDQGMTLSKRRSAKSLQPNKSKLKSFDDFRASRLNYLEKNHRDTRYAVEWFNANKNRFQKPCYLPVALEITLKDPRYADQIEQLFHRQNWNAFTFTCREDYTLFAREVIDGKGFSCHAVEYSNTSAPTLDKQQRPHFTKDALSQMGFQAFAIDLLEGPDDVLNTLCHQLSLHTTPVSLTSLSPSQQDLAVTRFKAFVAGRTWYAVRRSKYGKQQVSTVTRLINKAFVLSSNMVMEGKQAAQENLDRLLKDKAAIEQENEITRLQLDGVLKHLSEAAENRKRIVKEREMRTAAIQKHRRNVIRLENSKKQLEKLLNAPDRTEERIAQLEQKIQEHIINEADLAISLQSKFEQLRESRLEEVLTESDYYYAANDLDIMKRHTQDLETALQVAQNKKQRLGEESKILASQAKKVLTTVHEELSKLTPDVQERVEEAAKESVRKGKSREDIEDLVNIERGKLENVVLSGDNVEHRFEVQQAEIRDLEFKIKTRRDRLNHINEQIQSIKKEWEPRLDTLVAKISERFTAAFHSINCNGEVHIGKRVEYRDWRIEILVKFRETEQLSLLTGQRQSGGERSVSTVFYLMAMQDLAIAPFRVVDEINQGMDPRNERIVHARLVEVACRKNTSQYAHCLLTMPTIRYFLITPKILPDLEYHERMRVLNIFTGELSNGRIISSSEAVRKLRDACPG
ncbi:Structural maintenance of chromosomes protein 5 [Neolecta irregularis DAH-3]|uniref:Structural maintenance of chromosomes protein 5 n=1 Tax=Neolecta irregularis (strain DAH-3) TaxID=1198029 RepID=A0A1U7LV15_NEOID|nr:Structural maintenance of chromosomes protein 5 [Neolecta irregularis DAH-3]|eukprot:OLL26458.1 Structural maintenance of chromosomes protein 5 [Neolecta irregularis DAH-3]